MLQLRPGGDQRFRFAADAFRDLDKVRLVAFEEGQGRGQEAPLAQPIANPVGGQAGEVEEPLRAPFV